MKPRRRWLVAAGGVLGAAICVQLIVFAPAQLLAHWLPADGAIELHDWRGTLWRGSVQLSWGLADRARADPGLVAWELSSLNLLAAEVTIRGGIQGKHHQATFLVFLGPRRQAVTIEQGTLGYRTLKPLLAQYQLDMAGDLHIDGLQATLRAPLPRLTAGTVSWAGGKAGYALADQWFTTDLPALVAQVTAPNTVAIAGPGGPPLAELLLRDSGWLEISIRQGLLALAGVEAPAGTVADAEVLRIEQQLIPLASAPAQP